MSRRIILVGGGGQCKSVIEAINTKKQFEIIGIIDVKEKVGTFVNGIKVVGQDEQLEEYYKLGINKAFISIGGIEDIYKRLELYNKCKSLGYGFPNIIDSTAKLASNVTLGKGIFIGKGAIVNSNVSIKDNCIINTGSIIEHDCTINSFSHIASGGVLCGGVFIGENCHIGANSTVIQNIRIGGNSIIGAGSVVLRNIEKNKVAYGNPCREVRDNG